MPRGLHSNYIKSIFKLISKYHSFCFIDRIQPKNKLLKPTFLWNRFYSIKEISTQKILYQTLVTQCKQLIFKIKFEKNKNKKILSNCIVRTNCSS